jgi:ATP-binding cassette subfamily F protein uup
MLRQGANLVVMDEPTNDLDVSTLAALEAMLIDIGVTALVVTHDRYFLDRVATSILAFEGDGRVVRYPGNYDAYQRLRAEAEATRPNAAPVEQSGQTSRKRSAAVEPRKKLTQAETRELAGILDVIEGAEAKLAQMNARLSDPTLYSAGGKEVAPLRADIAALKAEIERLTARWEELETKKDST